MSRRLVATFAGALLIVLVAACSSSPPPEAAAVGGGAPLVDRSDRDRRPTIDPEPGEERFADAQAHASEDSARLSALLDDSGTIPTGTLLRWWASPVTSSW